MVGQNLIVNFILLTLHQGEPALICRAISRRCKTVSGDLRVTMWLCRWPPSPPCGGGEGAAIAAAIAAGSSPHPRAPAAAWTAIAAQLRALLTTLSSCRADQLIACIHLPWRVVA